MTKIIDLVEVIGSFTEETCVMFTKEDITTSDLLIAQGNEQEKWYDVTTILKPPYLKTGYKMLVLVPYTNSPIKSN